MPHKAPKALEPWVCTWEFPSFADADAFRALAKEAGFDPPLLRRKYEYQKCGAFPTWPTSIMVKRELHNRSFNIEMLQKILSDNGYSGTKSSTGSWLRRALAAKFVERIAYGEYRFLPAERSGGILPVPSVGELAHEDYLLSLSQGFQNG